VIAHLSGTLLEKQVQRLVVDVSGVGYDVLVPLSTFYTVGEPGAAVALRIHTHVREDAIQLFGFSTALELLLFEKLIATSGVGPKLALAVLSGIETTDLVRAVRQNDVARLTRIPGIGRKTAERLVVELKDRLPTDAAAPAGAVLPSTASSTRDDVVSALVNLGYQRSQVDRAVDAAVRAAGEDADFERILREALRSMTKGAGKA
jgi:Holliday junction DNA helicase RuvA